MESILLQMAMETISHSIIVAGTVGLLSWLGWAVVTWDTETAR